MAGDRPAKKVGSVCRQDPLASKSRPAAGDRVPYGDTYLTESGPDMLRGRPVETSRSTTFVCTLGCCGTRPTGPNPCRGSCIDSRDRRILARLGSGRCHALHRQLFHRSCPVFRRVRRRCLALLRGGLSSCGQAGRYNRRPLLPPACDPALERFHRRVLLELGGSIASKLFPAFGPKSRLAGGPRLGRPNGTLLVTDLAVFALMIVSAAFGS